MKTFREHMAGNIVAITPRKAIPGAYREPAEDDARADTFYPKQGMSGNKMGMYGNPAIADRGMTATTRDLNPPAGKMAYGGKGGYQDPIYGPEDTGEPDKELMGTLAIATEASGDSKSNPVDDLKKRVAAFKPDDPSLKRVTFHAWPKFQGTVSGQVYYTHTLEWKNVTWDLKVAPGAKPQKGRGRVLGKTERGHVYWHAYDKPKLLQFDSPDAFMAFIEDYPYMGLTQDDLRRDKSGKFVARSRGRWSSSTRPPAGSIQKMLDRSKKQVSKAAGVAMRDDERNRSDLEKTRDGGDPAADRMKSLPKAGSKVLRRRKPKKTEGVRISASRLQEIIREEAAEYFGI